MESTDPDNKALAGELGLAFNNAKDITAPRHVSLIKGLNCREKFFLANFWSRPVSPLKGGRGS